ncbi:MAG: HU family DNA-binding protein [Bacteroidales bacterium]|nr:HU family DNA-binding protein [Bacteroidales bacterium]
MNKTQLIAAVAEKSGMTKTDTAKMLTALLEVTKKEVNKKEGKVSIIGFGSFYMQKRAARKGKNPRTGAAIKIPAKKVLKFKASKKF